MDMETNKMVFRYFTYGASCSEVEIDCLTGDHEVPYHPKSILITVEILFPSYEENRKRCQWFCRCESLGEQQMLSELSQLFLELNGAINTSKDKKNHSFIMISVKILIFYSFTLQDSLANQYLLQVRRTDIVMDLGRSLNPGVDIGQVISYFNS